MPPWSDIHLTNFSTLSHISTPLKHAFSCYPQCLFFYDFCLFHRIQMIFNWIFPRGFAKEFAPVAAQIVNATTQVYKATMANLLPTPAKSHYLFNLRDFARVIQGVLLSVPDYFETPAVMKRLWVHEVEIFGGWFIFFLRYYFS